MVEEQKNQGSHVFVYKYKHGFLLHLQKYIPTSGKFDTYVYVCYNDY